MANTAERLVGSGASRLVRDAASTGAPRRLVLALAGVVAALLPGVTALLLVLAARRTLRLRALVGLLVVVLGAASFIYQSHGEATGVLVLALAVAAAAVVLTGPLVAAPLVALAALIGGEFLPHLFTNRDATQGSVNDLHLTIYNTAGTPTLLRIGVLVLAAIPFGLAARMVLRG